MQTIDNHPYYNFQNYPHFVGQSCRNWEIRRNDAGHCAALAVAPGCKSTHFGTLAYALSTLGFDLTPGDRTRLASRNIKPAWKL